MGGRTIFRFGLALILAVVGLATLFGLLGIAQEQVYAAPFQPVSQSIGGRSASRFAPPPDLTRAPAASPPVAPLRNEGGSTDVITVCKLSSVCPYTSVQAAVSDILPDGTVMVAQGVYTNADGSGPVVQITKTLTLQGGYTTTDWTTSNPEVYRTVLDGEDAARVLGIADGIAPVVEGFHIRNGSVAGGENGGGVYIAGGTPVMRRNRVYDNEATGSGAGVYIAGGSSVLQNNLIYSNTGGGIQGGGVCIGGGSPFVWYNTFYDNHAAQGGGLYIVSGSPVISANIVVSNVASTSGGGIYNEGGSPLVGYNDVVSNAGGDYVNVFAPSDIHADPLFVAPTVVDLAEADFHLQTGSDCRDAADPNNYPDGDYDGYARPFGPRSDIGAHEFYTGTCFVRVGNSQVYTTVQEAVNVASSHAWIKVAGLCTGSDDNVVSLGKDLTLHGGYTLTNWGAPDADAYPTILDGEDERRVVEIGTNRAVTITGFHIRSGHILGNGGGILVGDGSQSVIRDNQIYSNSTTGGTSGGGIYLAGGSPVVQGNEIYSNVTSGGGYGGGGGIYVSSGAGNPTIEGNWIHHNAVDAGTTKGGGGIYVWGNTSYAVTIRNNEICSNTAQRGGGVSIGQGVGEIQNNEIYSNTAVRMGGGIHIEGAGSATVEANRIYGNRTTDTPGGGDDGGGGVYVGGTIGSAVLWDNDIFGNSIADTVPEDETKGGGIHIDISSSKRVTVENNAVYDNSSGYSGGGLYVFVRTATAQAVIRNNLIYTNTAEDYGGGISFNSTPITIENNTIYDNWAGRTDGGGGMYRQNGSPTIRNNIVVSNTNYGVYGSVTVYYSDIWGNAGGRCGGSASCIAANGNITATPLFGSLAGDPAGWDLHLQSGSPCIDAAHPITYPDYDYDNYARPFGPYADMGAYEFYTGTCFARLSTGGRVYTTVQAAVYTATEGAEVRVAGLCQGTVAISKSLALRGGYVVTDWTTLITSSVLDGGGQGPVVTITGADASAVTISELIIQNGAADTGAGVYVATSLSPTIQNVMFYSNSATNSGGGFASAGGNPRLYNNTFVSNTAVVTGGGLYIAAGEPVISNTIVVRNTGGGIYAAEGATPTLAYNDVWGNSGLDYAGNVSAGDTDIPPEDPRFVDLAGADFRLQYGSPCIHMADPGAGLARDFEGDSRPEGPGYDIGADEATDYLGVSLGPDSYADGVPGYVTTYTHYLTNTGTLPDSFLLTHALDTSGGTGWDWGYVSVYTLSPGVATAVPVTILVPTDAVSGTQATLFLTATSQASPFFSGVTSNTTTVRRNWGALLAPIYAQSVNPGEEQLYVHVLTNTGNALDTFELDLDSSLEWAEMTPTDPVALGAGMSTFISITVSVPITAPGGVVETTVVAATSTTDPAAEPARAMVTDTTEIYYTAGDRYVAIGGQDTLNSCGVISDPCRTIGYAVGQAVGGDVVKVAEGTYDEHDLVLNKTIILQGSYSADFSVWDPDAHSTIIDAGESGRVLKIYGNPTVEGFTLRNGATEGSGAGVYVGLGTPTLRRNVITGNSAVRSGGGVYNAADLALEWCTLADNTAGRDGGGFYNAGGDPVVQYNVFRDNVAEGTGVYLGRGGGFYNSGGAPSVWTNVFHDNVADDQGGGLYNLGSSPPLWHNTFYSNAAGTGDGTGGGLYLASGSPVVSNTIVVSNTGGGIHGTVAVTVDYNDVWGHSGDDYGASIVIGPNNISENPLFLDAASGDFHLLKGSPCIDEGDTTALTLDVDGQPRTMGTAPDIGADEFQEAGVELAPLVDADIGRPAYPVTYTYILTNAGNYVDDFRLTWWDEHDWPVAVNGAFTQPVTVTVGFNAAVSVEVRVDVPAGILSGTVDRTIVTATSQVDTDVYTSAMVTTTVGQAVAVSLEPDRVGWGYRDTSVFYTHILTNTGNYTDTFDLHVRHYWTGTAVEWSVAVWPTPTVQLAAGMTRTIYVTVGIATNANPADAHTAIITATSVTDDRFYDIATDTTVVEWEPDVRLEPDNTGSGDRNAVLVYTHTLENLGIYTDTFVIASSSSQGWPATISPMPTVQLAGGAATTVYVTVTIPGAAVGGQVDRRVVTATSQSFATVYDTAINTTTVTRIAKVSLVPLYPHLVRVQATTATMTQTIVHEYTLINQGNSTDTFTLTVSSALGWPVEVWPETVGPLTEGVQVAVYVTHTVPPTVECPYLAPVDSVVATATSWFDPGVSATADNDTVVVNQCAGVELSPGYTQDSQPGEVEYTHVLTNTGNYFDTFNRAWSNDQGWAVQVSGNIINVGPKMTRTLTVRVTVPFVPYGTTGQTAITATSQYSPTFLDGVVDTTNVLKAYDVTLSPERTIRVTSSATSEVFVTYTHCLTNTSNCSSTFSLGVQSSFTPTVAPTHTSALTPELEGGGSIPVTVTVTVPPTDTDNLLVATAAVTAAGDYGGFDIVTDTIIVNQRVAVELAPDRTGVVTEPTGGTITYTHLLTNSGNFTDQFELTWQNEQGWAVMLDGSAIQPRVVELAPGSAETVTVRVSVLSTAYTVTNRTVVTATSRTPMTGTLTYTPTATAVSTTTVRRPHVTLAPDYAETLDPGTTITYVHTLTNSGGLTDTYLIDYHSSQGWASLAPTTVYTLPPGATHPVTVVIIVPPGVLAQDVTVVTATSESYTGVVSDTATDATNVPYRPGAELAPEYDDSAYPGTERVYTHTLTNSGNYTTTYDLSIYSDFSRVDPDYIQVAYLGTGQTYTFYVTVSVPPDAAANAVEQVGIIANFAGQQVVVYDTIYISYTSGTRYVAPNGRDERNNCTQLDIDPCRTVQHAVDQAVHGDVVRVASDTYTDVHTIGGTVQVVRVSKSITLAGGYASDDLEGDSDPLARPTVLDAQKQGRAVYVGASVTPTIEGFHLYRGYVENDSGAGLYIAEGAEPTVRLSRICSNTAAGLGNQGGGIYYAGGGNPVLERVAIYKNMAREGGGLYLVSGGARIWNNLIYSNSATTAAGGGLYNASGSPLVWNNTFYSNTAASGGGGFHSTGGSPIVSNTIVANNAGYGIFIAGGASPVLAYNDAWGNSDGQINDLPPGSEGNISGDPRFVDADFHLTGSSPCIDAGDPDSSHPHEDYDGNQRTLSSRHDIGAYEYTLVSAKIVTTTADPGTVITYTIGVSNAARIAHTFPITDVLHPYLYDFRLLSYPAGSVVTDSRTITWTGSVASNSTVYITFTARITDWVGADTPITNVARVNYGSTAIVTTTVNGKPGTRYVTVGGNDTYNGCRFPGWPCATIQQAVGQAQTSDEVRVAVGTYTDVLGAGQVVSVSKAIALTGGYTTTSWNDAPDPQAYAVLDGQNSGRGVVINGPGAGMMTLAGFRVVGGTDGVAAYTATAVISRSRIYSNSGDGIHFAGGDLTLERTWVYSNTGDGVKVEGGAYRLVNDVIAHNKEAGLRTTGSDGTVIHSTFARNTAAGAAISNTAYFTNTIFYSHTVAISATMGSAYLWHTLWWDNLDNTLGTVVSDTNNVYDDPMFVDLDYHIRSSSAALDQGVDVGVHEDIDGGARPLLGGSDIGADEYSKAITKNGPPYAEPGQEITYTIKLEGQETGLVLTDTLPVYVAYTGPVACTVGSCGYLPAPQKAITWTGTISGQVTITYTGQITSWLAAGVVITNNAQLEGGGIVVNSAPAETEITPMAGARYVATGGDNTDNSCRVREWPCATVQWAVDQALEGDVVKVAEGTYTGTHARAGVTQTVYISDSIAIRGGYTTSNWDMPDPEHNPTRLDAQGLGRVVYITGLVTVTVDGFHLRNGSVSGEGGGLYAYTATVTLAHSRVYSNVTSGTGHSGGGIYAEGGALTITATQVYSNDTTSANSNGGGAYYRDGAFALVNSQVHGNTADGDGGGFYLYDADAVLMGNEVYANAAIRDGGGVYCQGGPFALADSHVYDNTAGDDGGGFYLTAAAVVLTGNRVYTNTAIDDGGGAYVYGCDQVTLENNFILDNTGDRGGGMYVWGTSETVLTMTNNIVAANRAVGGGDGLYAGGSSSARGDFRHTIIADNGREGVRVRDFTLVMTNTVLVGHTEGITTTQGVGVASVTADHTLWYATGVPTDTDGTVVTTNDLVGDPKFVDQAGLDYHIRGDSEALNAAIWVGVGEDIDGDTRPAGLVDIGADQYRLRVTHSVAPSVAPPCGWVTHTLILTNLGDLPLPGVWFTETLPAASYVAGTLDYSAGAGWGDPDEVTWTGAVTDTELVTFIAQLDPYLTNGTVVTHSTTISDPISTFTVLPITSYSVTVETYEGELSKSALADTSIGQVVTYTVFFTVPAGHVAYEPVVVDALPRLVTGGGPSTVPALEYVVGSSAPAPAVVSPDGVLTWTLGTITATCGAPAVETVTFAAQVRDLPDNDVGDLLTNTVELSYTEFSAGGRARLIAATQTATLHEPSLEISKTAEPASVLPGGLLTYTLTVVNNGLGDATDLLISDTVPADTMYQPGSCSGGDSCGYSDGVVSWSRAALLVDEQVQVSFTVQVGEDVEPGTFIANQTYGVSCSQGVTALGTATVNTPVGCVQVSSADFSYSPHDPLEGDVVTFTGLVAAGTLPIAYTWNFGDGVQVVQSDVMTTTSVVTHTYAEAGSYSVVMTATNACGTAASRPKVVAVDSASYDVYLPVVLRN